MVGENVAVIDRTPVGGDETAIQSYLDLQLDKNDIVDSVITQKTLEKEDELNQLKEDNDKHADRLKEIKRESKKWIKTRFDARFKDKVDACCNTFNTKGTYSYNDYQYEHDELSFTIKGIGISMLIVHKEQNKNDFPLHREIKDIQEKMSDIDDKKTRLNSEIKRIEDGSKRVRLAMATELLKSTTQGRKLLDAMTLGKAVGKVKKELKSKAPTA